MGQPQKSNETNENAARGSSGDAQGGSRSSLGELSPVLLGVGILISLIFLYLASAGDPSGKAADRMVFIFFGLLLAFLMALDHCYALERLRQGKQDRDEHSGVSGYRRSIMAVGLILVFALVLVKLLQSDAPFARSILQNAVGILEGVLGALVGFYFGGKSVGARQTLSGWPKGEESEAREKSSG